MGRVSFLVFGYRRIEVSPLDAPKLVSLFLKFNIHSFSTSAYVYLVFASDFTRLAPYVAKLDANVSSPLGFPQAFSRLKKKIPTLVAFLFAVVINVFLSDLVWDIRINGNETVSEAAIEEALDSAGLSLGARWSVLDRSAVENETAIVLPSIGWININRRGTVAYVEIVERAVTPPLPEKDLTPSNLVAERDCVIVDIDVVSGVACVKPGDVVRRGDVLISGVVENEWGLSFVHAEGSVTAYVTDRISVEYPRSESVREISDYRLAELNINIFEKNINIFKKYRNPDAGCDIIEKSGPIATVNGHSLPLGFLKKYEPVYVDTAPVYSDSELAPPQDQIFLLPLWQS